MRGEMLDLNSICLGPFKESKTFDLVLSTLSMSNTDKRVPVIKPMWIFKHFEEQETENENFDLINRVREWKKITSVDSEGNEVTKWYLVIYFDRIDRLEQLKVGGDFRF